MQKSLIVKELKHGIALRVRIQIEDRAKETEVARFNKAGMGKVALGAAAQSLIKGGLFDEIRYDGSRDLYDKLVQMEVIQPLVPAP